MNVTHYIRKTSLRTRAASLLGASLLAVAAVGLSGVASPNAAFAQEEGRQFSAKSGEKVNEALQLASNGNTQAAVSLLQGLISEPDLNAYERSIIYQTLGQYTYELDRPVEAQQAFENAINAGGLLPNEVDKMKISIAQLMIGNGQYREGAQRLENYLNSGGQQLPKYIDLLVNAWVQAEDYRRALPWAEKWFNAANPKERKHFDLLNFLYNNLGMQGRQADVVKEMIVRWPEDKNLWVSWASMLASGGREQEAFEVNKMLYLGGALSEEQDLMKVVRYYSAYDMPYQAGEILQREMDAGRISKTTAHLKELSTHFRQAREYKRAIPIIEAAARQSGGGREKAKLYADLGEAYNYEGDCQNAENAFKQAINLGYDAGKAWLHIAGCRYDKVGTLERLNCDMSTEQMAEAPITRARNAAIDGYNQVPAGTKAKRDAQTWIKFIQGEKTGVDDRCEYERNVEKDLCYQKIKQSYAAEIFTGGFVLEDKSCERFIKGYDAEFRVDVSQQ